MAQQRAGTDEGRRLAASWQNKAAGRVLRAARSSMPDGGSKQAAFAARLGRAIGLDISVSTLSNWETGRRTVPGPVLIEAAIASSTSIDTLLGDTGQPETTTWAETLGLPQKIAGLEETVATSAETLSKVVQALEDAGLWEGGRARRSKRRAGGG
jgi:hypothetical protein